MDDTDNPAVNRGSSASPLSPHPFLSVIRGQTFDLLLHLSLNLPKPIRVIGPSGIGKTHFLRALERQAFAHATVCYQVASAGLSLERLLDTARIKAEIELQRAGHPFGTGQNDIHSLLEAHARNKQFLLLLLDNAQAALPGLLDGLSQFAGLNPALKLVIALNDDAVRDKTVSDPEFMNEAFEIEMPALGQQETIAYIRHIVATNPAFLPGESFGPAFHAEVFKASGGAPGQIEAALEQPRTPARRRTGSIPVGLLAGTGLLITGVAGGILYFGQGREPLETPQPLPTVSAPLLAPVIDQPPPESASPIPTRDNQVPARPVVEPVRPEEAVSPAPVMVAPQTRPEPEPPPLPQVEPVPAPVPLPAPEPQAVPAVKPAPVQVPVVTRMPGPPEPAGQPALSEVEATVTGPQRSPPPAAPAPAVPAVVTQPTRPPVEPSVPARPGGMAWVMSQPVGAYTLQVATGSNDEQLRKFMREHPEGQNWFSLSIRQGGRVLYPLYQGVYPDLPRAEQALRQWEKGAGKAFIRRFADLRRPAAPTPATTTRQPVEVPPPQSVLPSPPGEPSGVLPVVNPQDTPPAGVAVQPLEASPEIRVEPIEDDAGEETAPASQDKEIYYRLIEGQPPEVEIITPSQPTPTPPMSAPAVEPVPATPSEKPAGATLKGSDWLQAQPPESYTLQIITVSSVEATNQVARQFPSDALLAFYPVRRSQGLVYPVFYGIYGDVAAARQAMRQIPRQLGSIPLLRQFKTLQREIGPALSP